jgi:hypothetical protein
MIVVKVFGGLGNQLFQYAFGRRLAIERNTNLYLDTSFFNNNLHSDFTPRNFELNLFNVKYKIADDAILKKFSHSKWNKLFNELLVKSPFIKSANYLREPHFHFFERSLVIGDNVYVNGYWQSEDYFSSVRNELLDDLKPLEQLSTESQLVADDINKNESVAIHIRRGDYISDKNNASIYHICSLAYYQKSIQVLNKKLKSPKYFIFSDDPDWVEQNLKINQPYYFINHNKGKNSYQDLVLMSKCKHNIIANSSFSWWGAWLNQHENKIVIAPEKWFKDTKKDTKDLICKSWIKI